MTTSEFNEKYKDFIVKRFYGLDIQDDKVIKFLDIIFEDLCKIPGFKYFQIKLKFNNACVYFEGVSRYMCIIIEKEINKIING